MKEIKSKHFANGSVYCLELDDGYKIETTDTFLPIDTKYCTNGTNALKDNNLGSRAERWMCGVSTMSGCPIGCKFCATGQMKGWRNLTFEEIKDQVKFILEKNYNILHSFQPGGPDEFKINYTRMGEPFLNIENVKKAINFMNLYPFPGLHHYISTIGIKGSDFSWIEGNVTLQISLHSLNEERRRKLIPFKNLMTLEELGQIRTKSNLKTTLNLTLTDEEDFDIDVLKKYFDPEFFFCKISPLNPNSVSESNNLKGIIEGVNTI